MSSNINNGNTMLSQAQVSTLMSKLSSELTLVSGEQANVAENTANMQVETAQHTAASAMDVLGATEKLGILTLVATAVAGAAGGVAGLGAGSATTTGVSGQLVDKVASGAEAIQSTIQAGTGAASAGMEKTAGDKEATQSRYDTTNSLAGSLTKDAVNGAQGTLAAANKLLQAEFGMIQGNNNGVMER